MTGEGALGVTTPEMRRVSTSIDSLADELAADLRRIDDRVSGFVGSGWTGLSSGAFAESFWAWHEGAQDVHTGLTEMATLLGSAATEYDGQDRTAASTLSTQMHLD